MNAEQFSAEMKKLIERLAFVNQRVDEAPRPEPSLEGLSLAKMRRTAARLRAGTFQPPAADMTAEELVAAIERTIAYQEIVQWAWAEALDIANRFSAAYAALESKVLDDSLAVFHYAKKLSKERGPDSPIAKSVETMEQAWRQSFGRAPKHRRSKARLPD